MYLADQDFSPLVSLQQGSCETQLYLQLPVPRESTLTSAPQTSSGLVHATHGNTPGCRKRQILPLHAEHHHKKGLII